MCRLKEQGGVRQERKGEIGRYKGQLEGYEKRSKEEKTVMTMRGRDGW